MSANIEADHRHSSVILKYLTVPNIGLLFLAYLLIYLAFAYALPRVHGGLGSAGQFGDMFGVLNAFASGIAMIGVALAVWLQREQVIMQAAELKDAMQQAKQQTAAMNAQLETAKSQMQLEQRDYIVRNKPVVYTNRREDPERKGNVHYVAHNAGGGFAVNVFYFDVSLATPIAIGSLAAGEERVLPQTVNNFLQEGGAGTRHLVVAEGPYTRTTQWSATFNLRTQEAGDHRGQVLHAHPSGVIQPRRGTYQPLADFMTANFRSFHEQLKLVSEDGLGPRLLELARAASTEQGRMATNDGRLESM
jgi:hypothetical protein